MLQPMALGALLEDLEGVFWHRDYAAQVGWSLRGGLGGQIAVLFDGVPLLGGLQGLGPSRQLQTLDPRTLQAISLWRGPGSYLHGNHAFSGAIALYSRDPWLPRADRPLRWSARLRGSYSSADQSPEGHLTVALAGHPGGLLLAGGAALHGLHSPGGGLSPVSQSDYSRAHAMAKMLWRLGPFELRGLYSFGQTDDVKYPLLFLPQSDVFRFRERRHLSYLDARWRLKRFRLRLLASHQHLESYENTQDIALGTRRLEGWRQALYPRHRLYAMAHASSWLHRRFRLDLQVDWSWEQLNAQSLQAQGNQDLLRRDIPDAAQRHALSFAAGVHGKLLRGATGLDVQGGVRLQPYWGQLQPPNATRFAPFSTQGLPLAVDAGVHLYHKGLWDLRLRYSSGYRIPSWSEEAAAGPQGDFFQLPNPQLRAEQNHSLEASFALRYRQRLVLRARAFGQLWLDTLVRQPANFEGKQGVGGLQVLQFSNLGQWLPFAGAEGLVWFRIWGGWSAKASVAWLHLFDQGLQATPAFLWPSFSPLSGTFSTRAQFGPWGSLELVVRAGLGQTIRYAPKALRLLLGAKTPTYQPWTTISLRAHLRLTSHLSLVANLTNLLNQPYITTGALMYAAGFHAQFQLLARY